MSRNRYVSDYRIVETIDARGRVRSDYEYIGAPWVYASDDKTVRAARRLSTLGNALGWAAYVLALVPRSSATRTLYVSLPFIFSAPPLAMVSSILFSLWREKPPFEHRHADRLANRAPACTFITMLLSVLALIGEGVHALTGAELIPGDAVFCLGALTVFIGGRISHSQWKRLRCREVTS